MFARSLLRLHQVRPFNNFGALRYFSQERPAFHATTVLNVRKGNEVVMIADGQISLGDTVFKNTARKLRRVDHANGSATIMGFAGSAADCLTLMELLEKEMERYPGQTLRACLSLAS